MEGSISVPMFLNETLIGTFGIAKPAEYEFDQGEIQTLMALGGIIGKGF